MAKAAPDGRGEHRMADFVYQPVAPFSQLAVGLKARCAVILGVSLNPVNKD